MNLPDQTTATRGLRRAAFGTVGLAALVLACLFGFKQMAHAKEAHAREAKLADGPLVKLHTLALSPPERIVQLQGEALPYASTTLYAKVSGFLKDIRVDKGDHVRKGQVMGRLESPEVEQDFQSLKADALQKQDDLKRAESLRKSDLISQQQVEAARTAARMADAKLSSQGALRNYQVLTAPFDGVVTARYADPGALVQNAQNGASGAQPLVTVSKIDRLRVSLYLDQRYAALAKPGLTVTLTSVDRPDAPLAAKVTRTSGALDPRTRTLLTEVEVDNRKGQLLAGAFVNVSLALKVTPRLELPVEALVLKGGQTFVAVFGSDQKVQMRPVQVGSEDNQRLPVISGLKAGEQVILNPGEYAQDGMKVRPAPPAEKK